MGIGSSLVSVLVSHGYRGGSVKKNSLRASRDGIGIGISWVSVSVSHWYRYRYLIGVVIGISSVFFISDPCIDIRSR